jgi:alkaline phosphatase
MKTAKQLLISTIAVLIFFTGYAQKPKYIFFFIGDGMGIAQAQLTNQYYTEKEGAGLSFWKFPYRGFIATDATNSYITCSAAAGTALATGQKTSNGTISMTSDHSCDLKPLTIYAQEMGYKTGIISSVNINHATPAVFFAHNEKRGNYYELAMDLPNYGIDLFAGGGLLSPQGSEGGMPCAYENAQKKGYQIPNSLSEFKKTPKGSKVLFSSKKALDSDILTYRIDRPEDYPSLGDITAVSAQVLDNPKGFFMMVEGGAIDWTSHDNDAAAVIGETYDFDLAVREAIKFYEKFPAQTLIIVTADHETGGMALGSTRMSYASDYQALSNQKASYNAIADKISKAIESGSSKEQCMAIIADFTGLGAAVELNEAEKAELGAAYEASLAFVNKTGEPGREYGRSNPLAVKAVKMLAEKAGIGWTTWSHTAVQVPIFAIGAGAQEVSMAQSNDDLARAIHKIITGNNLEGVPCIKK